MTAWTRETATALLGTIAVADSRFAGAEPEEARNQADWWASRMNHHGVDPEFAFGCVARHYDRETRKITVADIIIPWGRYRDAEDAVEAAQVRARAAAIPDEVIDGMHIAGQEAPPWFLEMVEACGNEDAWRELRKLGTGRAWREARDNQQAVALMVAAPPRGARTEGQVRREERERDCHVKGCLCPHTACWAGWSDTDDEGGAVRRCPVCLDAVIMRDELRPKRKGKRR